MDTFGILLVGIIAASLYFGISSGFSSIARTIREESSLQQGRLAEIAQAQTTSLSTLKAIAESLQSPRRHFTGSVSTLSLLQAELETIKDSLKADGPIIMQLKNIAESLEEQDNGLEELREISEALRSPSPVYGEMDLTALLELHKITEELKELKKVLGSPSS